MAIYEFFCSNCGEANELFFKYEERPTEVFECCSSCKEHAILIYGISAPKVSYVGVNHSHKVPQVMKDKLNQLKKHYPGMKSSI